METNQSTALVIKEHDFQEAKNSLKKYTEQAKREVELSRALEWYHKSSVANNKEKE